ncbi:thermonuclease family protein [Sagittula sp. SSi028]|uniref:thermonuclease family protein n=1 Tax=Sagittula sp. SSi028 TaxID=3400636 RepID=UPI003AF8085E
MVTFLKFACAAVGLSTVFATLPFPAWALEHQGTAHVIDGDTLDLGDTRIRLHGIDAPERRQTCGGTGTAEWACGAEATERLKELAEGRFARCEELDRDSYGRVVARCHVGGRDIGADMVRDGMAVAFVRYSQDYVDEERAARSAKRGMHALQFDSPQAFRDKARVVTRTTDPTDCYIKGNISRSSGNRIYHMPGQRDYAATRINPAQGERCFSTEAEARAAGWRPARR